MTLQVNIELTPEQERLLAQDGRTAQELVNERLTAVGRQEIQNWWDSLTPEQKRAVYEAQQ